jgi:hypothetical protein
VSPYSTFRFQFCRIFSIGSEITAAGKPVHNLRGLLRAGWIAPWSVFHVPS